MAVYDKILDHVKATTGFFGKLDIVAECGVSMASAYNTLKKMETLGLVESEKRSKEVFYKYINNSAVDQKIKENTIQLETLDVNERFEYIKHFVAMVIKGINPSCLITGASGVGKSYVVSETLNEHGLESLVDYIIIKGHTSPMGLYEVLHNNRDSIIIFDDCDSVFDDNKSLNLLKGALDSYDVRRISWYSNAVKKAELEETFEFTGKIIFISNLDQERICPAVRSRTFVVDINLSRTELLDRISAIAPYVEEHIKMDVKNEVLEHLYSNISIFKSFNIRTFIKALRIRVGIPDSADWRKMVNIMA